MSLAALAADAVAPGSIMPATMPPSSDRRFLMDGCRTGAPWVAVAGPADPLVTLPLLPSAAVLLLLLASADGARTVVRPATSIGSTRDGAPGVGGAPDAPVAADVVAAQDKGAGAWAGVAAAPVSSARRLKPVMDMTGAGRGWEGGGQGGGGGQRRA